MFDALRFFKERHVQFAEEGHHHCHAGWAQSHCPFCSSGRDGFHLGFNLTQGNWNCWRCGSHSTWDVVGQLLNTQDKGLIYRTLQEFETGKKGRYQQKKVIRKKALPPPPGCGMMTSVHRRYLRGRNFDPVHLEALWDLQGTQYLGGAWAWRLIIPCRDRDGVVVAYQGRTLGDVKPRYKMSDDADALVDPAGILYGIDKARSSSVLVVEGATGVWRLGPGTVATLGIDWSPLQANQLRQFKARYILFDPEPVAQKRAEGLAEWLSYHAGTTEILSGFRTDPGEFSLRKAQRIRIALALA